MRAVAVARPGGWAPRRTLIAVARWVDSVSGRRPVVSCRIDSIRGAALNSPALAAKQFNAIGIPSSGLLDLEAANLLVLQPWLPIICTGLAYRKRNVNYNHDGIILCTRLPLF